MICQKINMLHKARYLEKSTELSQLVGINHNGPAIKGGCVTRRRIRAGSRYFSQEAVPVQGGYGTLFASHGTNFLAYTSVVVQG
jgi:hypothetical protein